MGFNSAFKGLITGLESVWKRGDMDTELGGRKPEGKITIGKSRRRWEDNTKRNFEEV